MRLKASSLTTLLAYSWLSIVGTGLWGYTALADGIERRRPARPPVEATLPDVPALLGGPETQVAEAPPEPVVEPAPVVVPVVAECVTKEEALALIDRTATLNDIHRAMAVLRAELREREWCADAREELEKAITIITIVELPPQNTPHDPNRPHVPEPPGGEPPGGPGGPGYRAT